MFASLAAAQAAIGNSQFPGMDTLLGYMVYQSYAGDPTSHVTPAFIGQHCLDTSNSVWYQAISLAITGWTKTSN